MYTEYLKTPLKKLLAFFIILLYPAAVLVSQNYPVQLHAQLIPPYSSYLPDYCDPNNEKLRLQLMLTDLSEPWLDVTLKIEVLGNGFSIVTSPLYNPAPIRLEPGVPYAIEGNELFGYLQTQNLVFTGIDPGDYELRKVLPEGYYSICVTALDYPGYPYREVSNRFCNQAWFILNDPPILNLPSCENPAQATTPQNVFFQWTPMHLSSPNVTSGTLYDLQLWEIFPADESPNVIIQSAPPLFTITTDASFYNYSIMDPSLVEGKTYVWRIRARELSGRDVFRNNGYSTFCTFRYGDPFSGLGNNVRIDLNADATSHRQILLTWNTFSFFDQYQVQIRKTGAEQWFEAISDSGALKINDLEPNTAYESRVRGLLPDEEATAWSDTALCATFQLPVYTCNDQNIIPDLLQYKPLLNAAPGMIIRVGQFEMQISSITPGFSPGYFSGTGKVKVAFGLNLNVYFQSAFISDNQSLISGQVKAVTEGISNWANQWEYDDAFFYNGNIDSVYTQNGLVYLINEDGDTTFLNDYSGGLLITDANGDQWVVNPDGSVTHVNNGGLLPVSSTPLTEQELQILRDALLILKNEFPQARLDSLESTLQNNETTLDQTIQQQRLRFQESAPEAADLVFLGASTTMNPNMQNSHTAQDIYKLAEINYNEGKILFVLTRELNTNEELNYLGKYLSVSGKPYKTFVAEQLATGQTADQVAWNVAENGVKELVRLVIKKKSTR